MELELKQSALLRPRLYRLRGELTVGGLLYWIGGLCGGR